MSVRSARNDYGYRGITLEDTSGPRGGLASDIFSIGTNLGSDLPEISFSVHGPRGGMGRLVRVSLAEAEQFSRLLDGLLADLRAANRARSGKR